MGSNYSSIIFFVAIIGVFYFLIIRPQKKRQTEQAELMDRLKPGAEIQTIGGILGTVVAVDDDRVRIAVADGSELELVKRAVALILPPAEDEAPEDEDADDDVEDSGELGDGEASDAGSSDDDAPSDDEASDTELSATKTTKSEGDGA